MLRSRQMPEVLWLFEFVRILTDAVTGLSHRCGRPLASEKEILKGHKMTFNLVRIGWPNTAAILALAAIPFMTLATVAERQPATLAVEQTEAAANCLTPSACSVLFAAAADPQLTLE